MPRNKYPEETRQKIIDAGIKTFRENGYDHTTILDIVSNMDGLTRGAFYHHFKSKEEVLQAICSKLFTDRNPFEMVKNEKGLNGLQKLQKAMKINLTDFDDEYKPLRIASMSLLKSPQIFMAQMEQNVSLSRTYVQPLIEEGVADGSLKVENPRLVAELFVLLFNFWLMPVIFDGDAEYMESKAELATEILHELGLHLWDEEFEELGTNFVASIANEA